MIPILIVTHGTLAESIVESLNMIYGSTEKVFPFNFTKDMDVEMLEKEVMTRIDSLATQDILIFTDMLGGSAFNTAMKIQMNSNAHIVTGINLMMLLDVVSIREHSDFETLKQHILDNKEKYISIFKKKEA